jgi:hypothetical protein
MLAVWNFDEEGTIDVIKARFTIAGIVLFDSWCRLLTVDEYKMEVGQTKWRACEA